MVTEEELLVAVDAAFRTTGRGLAPWPDPHPDRSPKDEEYSRLTNPERWRILGARAEAWLVALVESGIAEVERSVAVAWTPPPGPVISRADRVLPPTVDAIPLVVARSGLGESVDAGVVLGAGDPAVAIGQFPDCGCDACDSGSGDELDRLDAHLLGVVSGKFRRLSRGDQFLVTIGGSGWTGTGVRRPPRIEDVVADPRGWYELTGGSWL